MNSSRITAPPLTGDWRRLLTVAGLVVLSFPRLASAQAVTFADVAPILHTRCAPCHHQDGDAPFSLLTYDEVKRHAAQIVIATKNGAMPPWKPAPDSGPFIGERRLSKAEIARLESWVAGGAPEGTRKVRAPRFASGWLLGTPDLVLTLPAYTLRAGGDDVFRNFVVNVPGRGVRYVRGYQFRPGNRAVHHANIRIDRTNASRHLDDADPEPGYEGLILNSANYPDGHFLGWTPGQAPPLGSRDLEWTLDGGSDLVVQLHMQPTGKPETIEPSIALYFSDQPPTSTPVILRLGRQNIDIPSGARQYRTVDSFELPVDVSVLALQPHAHFRAHDVNAFAILPDGSRRTLIHIPDWDFRWQDQYRLEQPVRLPAGTALRLEYTFDNSDANPRNPDRPTHRVEWGWRSADEMGDVWIQMQTRTDDDRERLFALARRKMSVEAAIGSEVLVARTPDYVTLRNDTAVIYLDLGQPQDALRHFSAVTRLTPTGASAWYNEGVALEALGRRDDAADRYRQAIRLDPSYSLAHNNLGNMLAASSRLDDAIREYAEAVRLDASNAEAHCSLARGLTVTGRAAEAVREYGAALALRPDWAECLVSFAWLRSADADAAIRRPADAIAMAEHAVALTRRADASALDVLAVALASNGQFDAAVSAGEAAITVADKSSAPALAAGIRERVTLFSHAADVRRAVNGE